MKYVATLAITLAALFSLNSCSKSATDTLADAFENLAKVSEKSDLTAEQAAKALEEATAEIKKVVEMAKKDPEKVKKELKEFENTERGKKLPGLLSSSKSGKLFQLIESDPKVRAAAMAFFAALMEPAAVCGEDL